MDALSVSVTVNVFLSALVWFFWNGIRYVIDERNVARKERDAALRAKDGTA